MSQQTPPGEQFERLLEEAWESRMQADPLFATYTGDHRFNDRLPDESEASHAQWLKTLAGIQQRLEAIDPALLGDKQGLNYAVFARLLADEMHELKFHAYRFPVSKTWAYYSTIFEQLPYTMPFRSVSDYENYLSRLSDFSKYSRDNIELMQVGLDTGYLPPSVTLDGIETQIEQSMVSDPEEHLLYGPFQRFPPAVNAEKQSRLREKAKNLFLNVINPALQELKQFMESTYRPNARQGIAASELPDGEAFYQHRVRQYTSLDLSPEQIHQTGLDEIDRIKSEMANVIDQVDFKGGFQAFIQFLRSDPQFYAPTPEALLKETAYVLKRMDGELPGLFGRLPVTPYGIREIPAASAPASTTAYYVPAPGDGRSAGYYYVNTYDLKSRPLYEIEALSLHEAVPGHHLQIALQQELDLPMFRRFGGFTAFVEGWALYAERLGLETGFYTDPYSNFGRLSYEMWRACRLVVDTGMHALGWSRQQAIDFMAQNTSSTLLNITNEVDRYIAWPGQALAYKIGELKIRALRAQAENTLGEGFDIRTFHDLLLAEGALPLDLLESRMTAWIENAGLQA